MTAFFVVLGVLALIGLVAGALLYMLDPPPRTERYRIEQEASDAAWRIQQHTRAAVEQMLDTARRQHDRDQ